MILIHGVVIDDLGEEYYLTTDPMPGFGPNRAFSKGSLFRSLAGENKHTLEILSLDDES